MLKTAASGSFTSTGPTKAEDADLEEAIAKCFIGNLIIKMNVHDNTFVASYM